MGLHDVQVVLSSTNIADRIQNVNQQQGQVAQSQNAMQLENQARLSLTQTQRTEHETAARLIKEKDRRGRNMKRNEKNKDQKSEVVDKKQDLNSSALNPSGNNIDIKA
ncbi:MAG: hypothetical protein WCJ94_02930 [bacterium]